MLLNTFLGTTGGESAVALMSYLQAFQKHLSGHSENRIPDWSSHWPDPTDPSSVLMYKPSFFKGLGLFAWCLAKVQRNNFVSHSRYKHEKEQLGKSLISSNTYPLVQGWGICGSLDVAELQLPSFLLAGTEYCWNPTILGSPQIPHICFNAYIIMINYGNTGVLQEPNHVRKYPQK